MSSSLYPIHEPFRTASVAELYQQLLAHGHPASTACDELNELLEDDRVVVSPEVRPDGRLVLLENGDIALAMNGGLFDACKILVRQRGLLDPDRQSRRQWAAFGEPEKKGELAPISTGGLRVEAAMSDAGAPAASPIPEVESARRSGGRDPEHDWEGAARHVDSKTPLPRRRNGAPIIQRAIDLMEEWFRANDPPPPKNIRRWINNKNNKSRTVAWWGDDK